MDMTIGERIKLRRAELNISQMELAKLVGMGHQTSISKIEKGQRGVPLRYVKSFADALKTSPDYLLGETNDPEEILVPKYIVGRGESKLDEINALSVLLNEENRDKAKSYMKWLYQEQIRKTMYEENPKE